MKKFWIILTSFVLTTSTLLGLFFLISYSIVMKRTLLDTGLDSGWTTFRSEMGRFVMDAPKEWLAADNLHDDHDKEIIAGLIHRFPDVRIAKLDGVDQVEDAARWAMNRGSSFPEYFVISNEPYATPQGYQGQLIEYLRDGSNMSGKYQMHCLDWSLISHQTGYVFIFCTEVRQWPEGATDNEVKAAFMRMVDSIEFYPITNQELGYAPLSNTSTRSLQLIPPTY